MSGECGYGPLGRDGKGGVMYIWVVVLAERNALMSVCKCAVYMYRCT